MSRLSRLSRLRRVIGVIAAVVCLGSGCGDESSDVGADRASGDVAAIQKLFADYESAFEDHRYDDVCAMNTDEFDADLVAEYRESVDEPDATCPDALAVMAVGGASNLTLDRVRVDGDTARGDVGPNTWEFARVDGDWKVAFAS